MRCELEDYHSASTRCIPLEAGNRPAEPAQAISGSADTAPRQPDCAASTFVSDLVENAGLAIVRLKRSPGLGERILFSMTKA